MARPKIEAILSELRSWLPNYDHGPNDYPTLLYRILASLPGGEELEDIGYEPFNIAWHEADQLQRVLEAIQDKGDVEELIAGLIHEEGEEGEVEEHGQRAGRGRRRPRQQPWQPMVTYPKSPSGQYVLSRDGQEVMRGSEQQIVDWLHHNHSYSIDHALRHEGYSIVPVEGAGAGEARRQRAPAGLRRTNSARGPRFVPIRRRR